MEQKEGDKEFAIEDAKEVPASSEAAHPAAQIANQTIQTINRNIGHIDELERIEHSGLSPSKKIELFDMLARDFLSKKFHIKKDMEYLEMIKYFLGKGKPHIATFCHTMVITLYAGENLDAYKVSMLAEDLKSIIEKEQGPSAIKKDGFLRNIFHKEKKNNIALALNANFISQKTHESVEKEIENVPAQAKKEQIMQDNKLSQEPVSLEEGKLSVIKTDDPDLRLLKELNNMNDQLIPSLDKTDRPSNPHSLHDRSIGNLDDLERVKKKIEQRKRDIYARLVRQKEQQLSQ